MTEEKMKSIQAFANLATMISVIIALIAFYLNIKENVELKNKNQQINWQKSVVYEIVRDKPGLTLDQISSFYVRAATKYGLEKLNKNILQDQEINRVLLSLIESNSITLNENSQYFPLLGLSIDQKLKDLMLTKFNNDELFMKVRGKVLAITEIDSGKYTIDSLHRKLNEEGLNVKFPMLINIITDLRPSLLKKDEQGYLWSTYDEINNIKSN